MQRRKSRLCGTQGDMWQGEEFPEILQRHNFVAKLMIEEAEIVAVAYCNV